MRTLAVFILLGCILRCYGRPGGLGVPDAGMVGAMASPEVVKGAQSGAMTEAMTKAEMVKGAQGTAMGSIPVNPASAMPVNGGGANAALASVQAAEGKAMAQSPVGDPTGGGVATASNLPVGASSMATGAVAKPLDPSANLGAGTGAVNNAAGVASAGAGALPAGRGFGRKEGLETSVLGGNDGGASSSSASANGSTTPSPAEDTAGAGSAGSPTPENDGLVKRVLKKVAVKKILNDLKLGV